MEHPIQHRWDRSFWLPPFGYGNGLPADAWAPLVDVDQASADLILAALLDAGIPGYTAPQPRRSGLTGPVAAARRYRLWVDVRMRSRAEDVVRQELLRIARRG